MRHTFILYYTLHLTITITYCSYIYNKVLSCIFKINKKKKNRNIINPCYYGKMQSITKNNLIIIKSIIVWKWNRLFTKNYFRKKKINYCYGFMTSNFQIICGLMVSTNRQSPASTETPEKLFLKFVSHNFSGAEMLQIIKKLF